MLQAADRGGGLQIPSGDPDTLRRAAGQLRRAAVAADDAQARMGSAVRRALQGWSSAASQAFDRTSSHVVTGCGGIGRAHDDAAALLEQYAAVLAATQERVRLAITLVEQASEALSRDLSAAAARECAAATADAGLAASELAAAAASADRAQEDFAQVSRSAQRVHDLALQDLTTAESTVARGLHRTADDLAHLTRHELVDVLGAPLTLLELDSLGFVTASTRKALSVFQALRHADLVALERLSEHGFEDVAAVARTYGEDSPQALRAWLTWQQGAVGGSLREIGTAVDGMGPLARGGAGVLDAVGRIALPLGAFADVLTMTDGESTGLDRVLSGGNLAGITLAAAGTELGGGALGLVGVNAVADWIPVVGEIVMAATALYLAGEWTHAHWQEITDAGKAMVHGVENATAWMAEQELAIAQQGYELATAAVHGMQDAAQTAVHLSSAAVNAGAAAVEGLAADALGGASALADGVQDEAGKVLSSLNPFDR